jgi:uncharacterized protein DUF6210
MRRVVLWNLEGAAAIVLEASGVVYSNQTCGNACAQPEAEGILVPFNDDPPLDHPERALWERLARILENAHYLTPRLADKVDAEFAADPDTRCATVDRSRLKDSHESWVYIDLDGTASGLLRGFGRSKAVLTWPNSD